jgi:DNA-binding XRE family transcriptional regulator
VEQADGDMADHQAFYVEVGRRIRAARRKRKPALTQDGLAKLVGLTRTSITNVEQGRQKCLLHTLANIATALQVEPANLIPTTQASLEKLGAELKNRPTAEKDWIMSTITAAQTGGKENGA